VIPILQGTTEVAARNIVNNGFAAVVTVDAGWYGRGQFFCYYLNPFSFLFSFFFFLSPFFPFLFSFSSLFSFFFASGIYFTRDVIYAGHYSKTTTKVFVVTAVNLGNTLPVTELPQDHDSLSLKGKPVVPGYESHSTVVPKKKAIGDAFPLSGNQSVEPARHADELVFQNASIATLHHLHLIVATMFLVTFSNSYHHKFHFLFRFFFFFFFFYFRSSFSFLLVLVNVRPCGISII